MNNKFKLLPLVSMALLSACAGSNGEMPDAGVPVSGLMISPAAESLGFDEAGLDAIVAFHQQRVENQEIPGVAMLIARRGELVFEAAVGYADVDEKRPLEMDHLFRIYSMTKPVVTAAALQQIERKHFDLDTPISVMLPEFASMAVGRESDTGEIENVPATTPISVRHLLTHTAGFLASWSGGPLADLYAENGVYEGVPLNLADRSVVPRDIAQFTTRLAELPLAHEPGVQFTYGVSSDVMGRVIEVSSDESFDQYLDKEIFQPLKMHDTSFCVSADEIDRLTTLYEYDLDANLTAVEQWGDSVRACPVGVVSGGGGLVSTVHDYWRFTEALRLGGTLDGASILRPDTAALFEAPQSFVDESKSVGWMGGTEWGLSVAQVVDPTKTRWKDVEGNYYWSGAASTYFWIDPKNELVALIFTQILRNGQPNDIKWDYRDLVYDAFIGAPYPGR